jgi:hypothetical protein
MPALALVHHFSTAFASPGLGLLLLPYPLFATAAVVLACVVVHRWLTTTLSVSWLFDVPSAGAAAAHVGAALSRLAVASGPSAPRPRRHRFAA